MNGKYARLATLIFLLVTLLMAATGQASASGHIPVSICHKPGTAAAHVIIVDNESVLQAHLKHGDNYDVDNCVADNPTSTSTPSVTPTVTVTITPPTGPTHDPKAGPSASATTGGCTDCCVTGVDVQGASMTPGQLYGVRTIQGVWLIKVDIQQPVDWDPTDSSSCECVIDVLFGPGEYFYVTEIRPDGTKVQFPVGMTAVGK